MGRGRPEAFPGRAWKTRGKAACRRVCPDPEEPVTGPSVHLPIGRSALALLQPAGVSVSDGEGGLPGPTTAGSWVQATDTPPEGSQTPHVPRTAHFRSQSRKGLRSLVIPLLIQRRKTGRERGNNLPKASQQTHGAAWGLGPQRALLLLLHFLRSQGPWDAWFARNWPSADSAATPNNTPSSDWLSVLA